MKSRSTDTCIVTYGRASEALKTDKAKQLGSCSRLFSTWGKVEDNPPGERDYVVVISSGDLNPEFARKYEEMNMSRSRFLVIGEDQPRDVVFSFLVTCKLRSTKRFYISDAPGSGKTPSALADVLIPLLRRISIEESCNDSSSRILDAQVVGSMLHVVSAKFDKIEVNLLEVAKAVGVLASELEEFEVDDDGSYVYWPKADVHLGWEQLDQIVNPGAALDAVKKDEAHRVRFGNAVRTLREKHGILPGDIPGISVRQLRRIESGECRLTSKAITMLSKRHGKTPNEYMSILATTASR